MTTIDPTAEAAREGAREATGQFGAQEHTAPETALSEAPPLTDQITEYLREYAAAEAAYAEEGEGPDSDDAYEAWEDFQTGSSGQTYALLEASKHEIKRLQEELAALQSKYVIPEVLVEAIDKDHEHFEEPTLYVPEGGHYGNGWVDVIATSDGVHRKYTLTPEGDVERYFD